MHIQDILENKIADAKYRVDYRRSFHAYVNTITEEILMHGPCIELDQSNSGRRFRTPYTKGSTAEMYSYTLMMESIVARAYTASFNAVIPWNVKTPHFESADFREPFDMKAEPSAHGVSYQFSRAEVIAHRVQSVCAEFVYQTVGRHHDFHAQFKVFHADYKIVLNELSERRKYQISNQSKGTFKGEYNEFRQEISDVLVRGKATREFTRKEASLAREHRLALESIRRSHLDKVRNIVTNAHIDLLLPPEKLRKLAAQKPKKSIAGQQTGQLSLQESQDS